MAHGAEKLVNRAATIGAARVCGMAGPVMMRAMIAAAMMNAMIEAVKMRAMMAAIGCKEEVVHRLPGWVEGGALVNRLAEQIIR